MVDKHTVPPFAPEEDPGTVSETLKSAAESVSDVIEFGRRPGMPLSILSNVTREAPLGALLCAFLIGIAVARRR